MQFIAVEQPDDVQALDRLFAVIEQADGHRPLGEHKYLDLLSGGPEHGGLVGRVGKAIVAYIALSRQDSTTWAMELAIHPLHRARASLEAAIATGLETIRAAGGKRVRVWAFQPHLGQALVAAGFQRERELRQLWAPLPRPETQPLPSGFRRAIFRPGTDDEVWLTANNRAFAGHPENGSWTLEVLKDRQSQPWFDPAGFVLAWRGDELAGFCWTKIHDSHTGEIYVIAVDPVFGGHRLGRSLVGLGLAYLSDVGCDRAILYVDADNRPALALYDELGFELHHIDRSFTINV